MSNPWFRMYAEFAHDPKVQMLSEVMQRRLLMLFCFRCNGHVTLQDAEVTFQLRITPIEWAETKAIFIEKCFIDTSNNIINWDKRQYRSDTSTERVRKHREAKKQADVTPCNVTVTPPEQIQIQIQNRKESNTRPIKPRRKKPKLELAEWEQQNGEIKPEDFEEFANKQGFSQAQIKEMLGIFKNKCEAKAYDYANFRKAFVTWDWKEFKQTNKPKAFNVWKN